MPRILTLLLLALSAASAHADEDPLCANHRGLERLNPFAASALAQITKCVIVYCDPKVTDGNAKKNLKYVDTKLVDLNIFTSQTNMSLQKFIRACKALNGDMSQVGPKMDAMRTASAEFGANRAKLSDLYEALQHSPDEDLFNDTSVSMARDYKQPNCMNQINKFTIDELNAAQDLLNKKHVDCSAPR